MAWKISKAKRQALVKLQLRDKKGRWIEMGGGVKWYSSRLKKQVAGTVVGTKGENALVRLNKENPTHEPALVSVPARSITVVDSKASLAPNSKMGTPTDKTSAFEKPLAVANEANGAPKSNGYVKPTDSPEDWNVSVTSDGRAYIGRKDGAELYFPARSLEEGDVLVAPEGGDETKPFSIGKGWAKKGVESVNTKGPKTGTVLRIEGDRYAVVQLPDGFTVEDKKRPGEQTDLITVGLSNSVIKLTDGMKTALGDHLTDTFDGNAEEQEVDDSEEEQSDHVGREVPEEEVAAEERDPADVDLTDITDGEEEEKADPITERAREIDVPQADNSGSDDQSLNENGLTDDEQKLVHAYDRMAQRAYDKFDDVNGDVYSANANRLRKLGEDRRAGAKADEGNPSDTPVKDPQNAPKQEKAPEPTPEPEKSPEATPEAPEAAKTNVSLDDLEKQAKADGDTVLYHGGLPEGTTLDDIDLNRNGSQQNKRGRSFGGFYLTDESSKKWSEDYAEKRNGVMHGYVIDKNARIDDRGSEQIDRISAEDRAEAAKDFDVIKGKDLLGRTQYVLLNKDAVKGVGETNIKDDKSSENSAPSEDAPQPVSDAEKQYDAIKAEVRAVKYPTEDENGDTPEPDLDDPRIKAAEDAEQNAYDSVSQGQVEEYTPEWFDIWNSTYHDSLETQQAEAAERERQAEQDAESERLEAEDGAETPAPNLEEPDEPVSEEKSARDVADAARLTPEILDSLPEGTVLRYHTSGGLLPTDNIDGKNVVLNGNAKKVNGKWSGPAADLDSKDTGRQNEAPTIQITDIPKEALANRYVVAVPLSQSIGGRPFDGDMDGLTHGDFITLKNGKKGPYSPKPDGSPAITTENHNGFRQLGIKAKDIDRVKKVATRPEETQEAPAAPNLDDQGYPETSPADVFKPGMVVAHKRTGKQRYVVRAGSSNNTELYPTGAVTTRNIKNGKPFGPVLTNRPEDFETPKEDPYRPERAKLPGNEGTYTDGADYEASELSPEDVKRFPVGTTMYGIDEEDPLQFRKYVKIGDNEWLDERDKVVDDLTMAESDGWTQAIFLPDNERNPVSAEEVARLSERFANGKHRAADDAWDEAMKGKAAWDEARERERAAADQAETERLEAEDRAASEATPEAPQDAPEAPFTYTEDQPYPNLGMDEPTLFRQTLRGNTRNELEMLDESARESEYDQGYRIVDGKFEVYDFDRALSSLEDNLEPWVQRLETYPTRENPNAHGYNAGVPKAKTTSIVNGIQKLQEAVRAAKAEHDSKQNQQEDSDQEAPEAPQDVVNAPEASPEATEPVDGEPDAAVVSHLNENAVLGNDDERRAAGLYLGGARYNDALRNGNVPEGLQKQIDDLTGFIEKQPEFGQETSLYRGMPGNYLENAKDRVGEVVTEPAFMSTSLKRSEAAIFGGSSDGSGVIMELKARPEDKALSINAAYMTDQSGIPEEYRQPVDVTAREAEMLMKPNTSFKINGVEEREIDGRKYQYVQAEVVDSPEAPSNEEGTSEEQLNERGLTQAEEDQVEQHYIDADVEGRAGDDYGVQEYRDKADEILKRGEQRLAGEEPSEETSEGHEVYTEGGPGRVPDRKATVQAIKESGVESVHIPASDSPKKDFTPEEIEYRLDRQEKTGLWDYIFENMPAEYKRFKDQDAPADPINLPEAEEETAEAPASSDRFANLKPTADEQSKLDEFDKAMDEAVASDDVDAYDVASDAKYDLMEEISSRPAEESAPEAEVSESEPETHPLDELGIERRTPEAIAGEDYAPTQQQQDVIDAVLGGLDTKVQAMAGTGKTSTLVALSRRIGEKGGQAIYIAFNKTVQEEAVRRMKGLPVEAKTGHGVAHTWATKNMPHLTTRLGGFDPQRPVAYYKNGKPSAYAKKKAWTSASAVGDALGIKAGDVKEESGIPKTKAQIVLAVKKTVERYALSDSDTIETSHVPDTFEIAEEHLPKIVEFANEYWEDLKREDGNFRVTHDVYRKFWALSRPDLTDGTGGNTKGANILYIDEAQDTPPVLAKVVADQKMQKVIVGDANQAIYAFAENIDYLSEADGDIELPLNKSWRFGPEVADAGNRFLQMLGSDNRVVGGGGPSTVTYGMENADAVLVRTNAGMIHAILDEAKRDRRVTAPNGTRANLESLVETVEALKEGYEIDTPHDDLIGFKNWEQVLNAHHSGDRSVSMIAKLFDVVDKRSLATLKQSEIEDLKAKKMEDAKKAIDHLVIDVPLHNTLKLVQEGDRTYLEPVDENPFPVDEKGKQKPWGPTEKKWAAKNFSQSLGMIRKPYLKDRGLSFGDQMMKYHKEGGIETVGWKYERGRYYTEDENVVKKFATYSGESDVTISTAHKSKGLEWDRVRIGDDFIGPYEDAKTGAIVWPEDDEYKLGYVALTRAAKELDPGSLSYVYEHTQPNGGVPGQKKNEPTTEAAPEAAEEVAPEVVEDTAPEPQQIAEEPLLDSTPDTDDVLDEAAKAAPAPVEETEDGEPVEAPFYDDITGLTVDEEAHKDSLLAQVKEARQRGDWNTHGQLVKEVNKMFDMGRERWKAARDAEKQNEESTPAPEPVVEAPEPEVTPEAPAPKIETPKPAPAPKKAPARIPAPAFDDDGLTPEEAARVANLEKWINDVYKGYGQGNVRKMENEVNDLLERGQKRLEGHPEAKLPVDITPEFETPAAVADAPAEGEAPSPVDGVSVAAPKPKKTPTGRKRGQSTVADANGDQIRVGDTITHKKHGPVTVTGVLPGAGRVNFIDPKTGKESSVKGDAISLKKDEAPAEAPMGILTGTPGDRLMDPNSGKKAFIGGDGLMIVTGERVRDTKTGEIGIVQTVYTGADKKASVPVLFPGNSEPRRVRGTVLVHADNEGGENAPETLPEPSQAPEVAPEAPTAPEATPEAPEEAPEVAPEPVVVNDEKTERRRAALGNAPEGAEVRSKDGGEVYTKLTADFWENEDQTDSFTDDEVLDKILNGERDGKGYVIRTPRPEIVPEPEPEVVPEPEPEVEIGPAEPDTSLSGQALADTITYESTLHMTDGDLAEMMSRYVDDPVVFDKIMEVMDERDANVFLEVDTSKTGATLEDQPSLFDIPEPVATAAAAKSQKKLTPQQKASEEYQNYVMAQYFRAADELNGVLLNEAGKAHFNKQLAIDIFSGSVSVAHKYASEELLQWWRENGRETLASFRFGMYGWEQDRKAAQTARNLGYQRGSRDRDRSNF